MRAIAAAEPLDEFLSDPLLTIACVLLIAVSAGWVVVTRLIVRNRRRAVVRGLMKPAEARSTRDIWTMPP